MIGSSYLAWAALGGERLPGCGPESGCDEVLSSRWARIFGIPVAWGALLVYGALGWAAGGVRVGSTVAVQRGVRAVAWFAAVLTLGAAAWFVGLQVFVVGAVCVYCMSIHTSGSAAALLVLLKMPLVQPREPSRLPRVGALISRPVAAGLAVGALVVVALLGLGQSLHQPPVLVSRSIPGGMEIGSAVREDVAVEPGNAVATRHETAAVSRRTLRLHGGAFEFDLNEVPYLGATEAPQVVMNLFDYTCQHCRVLHGFLGEARRTFSNELGIVSLPAPLDPGCNALVPRHLPDHTNACVYARIGLAVWRADREQLEAFDRWMFTPPRPPTTEAAREHAIGLVGAEAFARASQDPWVESQLEQATRLFATNYALSRISRLPQLVIGTNIVVGNFRRVDALYQLLSTHLNLVAPPPAAP
jgi:uncharacterized membrane protein